MKTKTKRTTKTIHAVEITITRFRGFKCYEITDKQGESYRVMLPKYITYYGGKM